MSWVVIFSSASLFKKDKTPYEGMQQVIEELDRNNNPCILVSNKPIPPQTKKYYLKIIPFQIVKRQGGIRDRINNKSMDWNKTVIVACSDDDFQMAVNSKILYLTGKWSHQLEEKALKYGFHLNNPSELGPILNLLDTLHPWYYQYESENFCIYSMTNAGDKNNIDEMSSVKQKLRTHLKDGDHRYEDVFKTILVSSLLKTPAAREVDYWAYYPASNKKDPEDEIISDYANRARYDFGCRSQHKYPLLIRHQNSIKRHLSGSQRENPHGQLSTIHIHPWYKDRLQNKIVAVVDDFTTYGTSFGVANALFKAARAKKVLCFAMGKFGNCTKIYQINMNGINPYIEIKNTLTYRTRDLSGSQTNPQALNDIVKRINRYWK